MELIIQQEEIKQTVGFTVRVDTEDKDFKKGDIVCGYIPEFPNIEDKNAPPEVPQYWCLRKILTDRLAKFYSKVDKHYKVIEIC